MICFFGEHNDGKVDHIPGLSLLHPLEFVPMSVILTSPRTPTQ
jgi:hypothetical protein